MTTESKTIRGWIDKLEMNITIGDGYDNRTSYRINKFTNNKNLSRLMDSFFQDETIEIEYDDIDSNDSILVHDVRPF